MSKELFDEDEQVQDAPAIFTPLMRGNVTKEDIKAVAALVVSKVEEGEATALEAYIKMSAVKKAAEDSMAALKDKALGQADLVHKEERVMFGAAFDTAQGSLKYDYSDSPAWVEMNEQLEELKAKIKAHEDLMRNAMKFEGVVGPGGEVIEPAKVSGGTAASLRITFK